MTRVPTNQVSRLIETARAEGRRDAETLPYKPCIPGIMRARNWSYEMAMAYASAFHRAKLNRGKLPETRCDCALNSPFKS